MTLHGGQAALAELFYRPFIEQVAARSGEKSEAARQAEARFLPFVTHLMPSFLVSWHHRLIAEHLEAVERGDITRLIITTPPRHSKSLLVSQFLPAWYLGRNPDRSIILASYAFELATTFGAAVRDTIAEPAYQEVFPGTRVLRSHSAAHNWKLAGSPERSSMLSAGVGGPTTGFGAHLLIIDDPLKNAEDAGSDTIRRKQWEWYTTVARTRLMPDARICVVMTRWHHDDLVGRLLEQSDGWTVLHLKALADEEETHTLAGGDVVTREPGDALWPGFFTAAALTETRRDIGEPAFSALYQGEPVPSGGYALKMEWLHEAPEGAYSVVHNWPMLYGVDPSTGEGEDYTAIAKLRWDIAHGRAILVDVLRGRWTFTELVEVLKREAAEDEPLKIVIEKVAFSAWVQQHLSATTSLPVTGSTVSRVSKANRLAGLMALGAKFEIGRLMIAPERAWTPGIVTFMQEWGTFPAGRNDDTLDAVSIASESLVVFPEERGVEPQHLRYVHEPVKVGGPRGWPFS